MKEWNLAERHHAVLQAISKFGSAKLAARELGLSFRSVEAYMSEAKKRMGAPHTIVAVLMYNKHRICTICANAKQVSKVPN